MGWLVFGGYAIGFVLTARRVRPIVIDEFIGGDPDLEEKIMGSMMALLAGFLWPLALLGVLVFWNAPKSLEEVKQERREFELRTMELERENERLRKEYDV